MTIEEKLENFYQVSMDHARERSAGELEEYKENLDKVFEDHRETAERQAKLARKVEEDEIRRVSNMEISREQLQLRHELSLHIDELETKLFEEVDQMIAEFKAGPEYLEWLKAQIREELAFDPEADLRIYIDASDEKYLEELRKLIDREDVEIRISAERFGGGTRGVIHSRNVLIDNSLKKKLADVRSSYQLREEL